MSSTRIYLEYPRHTLRRKLLRGLVRFILSIIADFRVEGKENIPETGPMLVVFNHFNFIDPVVIIAALNYPIEFIAGNQTPNAPPTVSWLTATWDVIKIYRGNVTTEGLKKAESVLAQNGVVGIAPEAGSWAEVLRPARPGAAFLAARTKTVLLPMGLINVSGTLDLFKTGRRPKVTVRIGEPFGPYEVTGRGRERRDQLEAIGDSIMEHIAPLIPQEQRGYLSDDPAIREAAKGTEIYPWTDEPDRVGS